MKEICIPVTDISKSGKAEVTVRSGDGKQVWRYRIEPFYLGDGGSVENRIRDFQHQLDNYDPSWELVQVLDTDPTHTHVHVLYREKRSL